MADESDYYDEGEALLRYTVEIVTAHIAHNSVGMADVPNFIVNVHDALASISSPAEAEETKPEPIVPVRQSVKPDYLICLDCGRKLKTLKAHLRSVHGMTFADYREKWGLPRDYPSTAETFKQESSERAKKLGLHDRMIAARNAKRQAASKPPIKRTSTADAMRSNRPKLAAAK